MIVQEHIRYCIDEEKAESFADCGILQNLQQWCGNEKGGKKFQWCCIDKEKDDEQNIVDPQFSCMYVSDVWCVSTLVITVKP